MAAMGGMFSHNNSSSISAGSLNVGGVVAISAPASNKIVIGQSGCEVEVAGNLTIGLSRCLMCSAPTPMGVLLSGASTRVLFCFSCAKQHLHGSVKELVDALDVKDKMGEPS